MLVLTSLAGADRHGYALLKDIESFSGVTLSPGTLYGALAKLEADGYVERLAADDRRHPYRLTSAGREALAVRLVEAARVTTVGLERIALVSR
jgi:DNA-binding PadR family transcriptional regulator